MPWIDQNRCTGCGVCVKSCPTGAISLDGKRAVLEMNACIRCGTCHDVCPAQGVRHDSELTEWDVEANVREALHHARACEDLTGNPVEGLASLERHLKHYHRQKLVAEKTLSQLQQALAARS